MKNLLLFLSLFISINTVAYADSDRNSTETGSNKGLFSIQFSWNNDSYSNNISVEIEYKKKGFLKKTKASNKMAIYVKKNEFINLELPEGEYEILAVRLKGGEIGYNQYLKIPFEGSFNITTGQVTNGGLVYLIRENKKAHKIMNIKVDNTKDVKRYINIYKPEFAAGIETMQASWEFLDNEKVDNLVKAFADLLIRRENLNPKPKYNYKFASLGMIIKMKRNSEGKVIDYNLISTPTYQQIKEMSLVKDGKILCKLENGSFLYGTDEKLEYIPLPKALEKEPELHVIKNNRFLLIDANFNIFSSDRTALEWKEQLNFNYEQQEQKLNLFGETKYRVFPKFYKGKQHMYIFAPSDDKHKILLQSRYDDVNFTIIPLSKTVKEVPLVTETPTHIIIGPHAKVYASAKRPAYLYLKEHDSDVWDVRDLPRGDCKQFYPGKDDKILYTECSKNNWYESHDDGLTWSKWQAEKSQ